MKIGAVAVAFHTERFSKVFIESFLEYYPGIPLVIVDNNIKGEPETDYLQDICKRRFITYLYGDPHEKEHGAGLDVGYEYFKAKKFDVILTLDIDTVIIGFGLIDEIKKALHDGYLIGGRYAASVDKGPVYVHPSCAYYCISLLKQLGISFLKVNRDEENRFYDTAEKIFEQIGVPGYNLHEAKYLLHFGAGSAIYDGKFHCKTCNSWWSKTKYRKRLEWFFNRPDVKEYLER